VIKRRALEAGLPTTTCCHTFHATGITAYLEGGGTVENAQAIANHADSRTTKLYDRRGDKVSLDEIEKIKKLDLWGSVCICVDRGLVFLEKTGWLLRNW
jgi:integrase